MFAPLITIALALHLPIPRMDHEGLPLPPEAVSKLGSSRFRGAWGSIALSADGTMVYSTHDGFGLSGWDTRTGNRIFHTPFTDFRGSELRLKQDELWISGHREKAPFKYRIRALEVNTGQFLRDIDPDFRDPSFWRDWSGAYSSDGKWLATCGNHLNGQVITGEVFLVPANGGKPISVWKSGLSHECRFSPDDRQLAIFSSEEVVLIDVATQKVLQKWAHKVRLFSASFSPDGKRLAFRYWKTHEEPGGDLYLWDLAKPEPRLLYRADPKHQATDCQFTPDGKLLSAYVQGKDLVYLDVESGQVAKVWKNAPWNVGVFSPDGKTYYYPDREVGAIVPYSFETGKPTAAAPDPPSRVDAIAARADGTVVGMCGTEAVIWDLTSGRVRGRTVFETPVADMSAVALSPDGDTVLLGFPRRAFQSSLGNTLALADARTGKSSATWKSPESEIMSFEMSNSGARVALLPQTEALDINGRRSSCGLLRVWDKNGKLGLVASSELGWWHFALSSDGRYAAAQEEKKISLWKLPDKEPARVLPIPRGSFDILEFSPDGRILAAIVREYGDGNNGPTRIMTWEVPSGRLLLSSILKDAGYPRPGAISPDGRNMACGNAPDTRLIELVTGQFRHRFPVQSHALAFTPDNRFLITAAADAPGYVWDIRGSLSPPSLPANWDRAWNDLIGDDAEIAFQAIRTIAAHPKSAIPFLRKRVAERPAISAEKLIVLIEGLKSERFAERERATEGLGKCAELAEPGVLKSLDTDPSPELHKRANQALRAAEHRFLAERRWAVRVVEAVEWSGTPEAREVLKEWSRGPAHSRLTIEADASVRRLELPKH